MARVLGLESGETSNRASVLPRLRMSSTSTRACWLHHSSLPQRCSTPPHTHTHAHTHDTHHTTQPTTTTPQGNVKEARFGVDYFAAFDLVLNGLDNMDARRHVNRLCAAAGTPLVESGTAGYLGQVWGGGCVFCCVWGEAWAWVWVGADVCACARARWVRLFAWARVQQYFACGVRARSCARVFVCLGCLRPGLRQSIQTIARARARRRLFRHKNSASSLPANPAHHPTRARAQPLTRPHTRTKKTNNHHERR